jgi:hypothetical protein
MRPGGDREHAEPCENGCERDDRPCHTIPVHPAGALTPVAGRATDGRFGRQWHPNIAPGTRPRRVTFSLQPGYRG